MTLNRLLKIVAFVVFLVALAVVALPVNNFGTWQEWIAAGLAVTTLAEIV